MRSRQKEIDKVSAEVDRRTQEITDLQLRLQDAEKTLVCKHETWQGFKSPAVDARVVGRLQCDQPSIGDQISHYVNAQQKYVRVFTQ